MSELPILAAAAAQCGMNLERGVDTITVRAQWLYDVLTELDQRRAS